MDDAQTPAVPEADRQAWVARLRRVNEAQEDAIDADFDAAWGLIEDDHRDFLDRFLGKLPPEGGVLDAACGTGKYFPVVLASGRSLLGVDHSDAHLASARAKFPDVPIEEQDLQDLAYRHEFAGVMCVDAMEMIPPEDWPVILDRFRRALLPGGVLYLTVELHRGEWVRRLNEETRRSGIPVVDGEVVSHPEDWVRAANEEHAPGPHSFYHYFPRLEQVRAWLVETGFAIEAEAEGPWHNGNYAYQHVLARTGTT
ncbi:MAG TPA: methyltransferase domain-containing protein [Actinomycetota bacterium]|nr:methyltransferase domain-containing protein [Actinomycetota bacterium]